MAEDGGGGVQFREGEVGVENGGGGSLEFLVVGVGLLFAEGVVFGFGGGGFHDGREMVRGWEEVSGDEGWR